MEKRYQEEEKCQRAQQSLDFGRMESKYIVSHQCTLAAPAHSIDYQKARNDGICKVEPERENPRSIRLMDLEGTILGTAIFNQFVSTWFEVAQSVDNTNRPNENVQRDASAHEAKFATPPYYPRYRCRIREEFFSFEIVLSAEENGRTRLLHRFPRLAALLRFH